MNSNNHSVTKQSGIVLVVSLVFLIALTGVASALMLNSTIDMKMAGASQSKIIAVEEGIGELASLILTSALSEDKQDSIQVNDCPASRRAYSTNIVRCVTLKTHINKHYGKNNSSVIKLHASITKQVLAH